MINTIFADKTFADCSLFATPKDPTPPNFAEKTFKICAKVFSLEKFPAIRVDRYHSTRVSQD